MSEEEKSSLFSLSIDDTTQSHLLSIAKWHKFIAIAGMAGCSLCVAGIILSEFIVYNPNVQYSGYWAEQLLMIGVIVLIIAALFIPCIFQLKFANKMIKGLAGNDQFLINESFKHLKIFSRYWGVIMIIAIGVVVFSLFITLIN